MHKIHYRPIISDYPYLYFSAFLSKSMFSLFLQAVRSTHSLEVPLTQEGKLLVEPQYIHFLCQVANKKMEENLRRIHR